MEPVITWDEPKRLSNIEKHGLNFEDLDVEFFLTAVVVPVKDRRFAAINSFEDGTIVVVFMRLGTQGLSIISMRPASAKERKKLP